MSRTITTSQEERRYAPFSRSTLLKRSNTLSGVLIASAVIIALAAGLSGMVHPSSYAPLLVISILIVTTALVAWFRKPVWALYATLFVIFLPIGLIPQNIHSTLNRSMTMIVLAVWLFDVVARKRPIVWTTSASLMCGFLIWGCITLFWVQDFKVGLDTLQVYALRFMLFLLLFANLIREKRDLDGLMGTLILIGLVLIAATAWTILSRGYAPETRLKVFDMNENELGIVALISLIGVLWHTTQLSMTHSTMRTLIIATSLSIAIGLIAVSGSRGSTISLVLILVSLCFWTSTRKWGIMGLSLLILGGVGAPLLFSTTLDRFAAVHDNTILGGREDLWQAAWQIIRQHPLEGVGIGNAPIVVLPLVRTMKSVWGLDRVPIHNPILTIWSETGVLGLALYVGVLASAVGSFIRQFRGVAQRVDLPIAYFALTASLTLGFVASWIKGGGMESDFTYFLVLALLLIPAQLETWTSSSQVVTSAYGGSTTRGQ